MLTRAGKIVFGTIGIIVAISVWAVAIEPGFLFVDEIEISSPQWPADHRPIRIALVADLQIGSPHNDLERVDQVVTEVNASHPDLILLLGDFVSTFVLGNKVVPPEPIVQKLAALRAPLGSHAILGNHDWWFDGERVRRSLEANGIPVLENQVAVIGEGADRFALAGLADDKTRMPEVAKTLAQVPDGMPLIVVTHDPVQFADIPDRAAVTFAGHTHGGQIYIPFFGAPWIPSRAPRRWAYGHIVDGGRYLFVSAGIGTSILPIRLNMPPAIEIVTLRSAAKGN